MSRLAVPSGRHTDASLKRLGTDHVDLYQTHGWDPAPPPVEETLRALEDVVRQGLVRYIGVSNWAAQQVATALVVSDALRASRVQTYQGYYSLVGREIEREVTPMLDAHGMGLIVLSPLAGGFLTGKYRDGADGGRRATIPFPPVDEERGTKVLDAMDPIAAAYNTTLDAVAIAWLHQQKVVTSIITGVKSVEQLEANLKAVDATLTDEEMKTLNEIGAPAVEYPGCMLAQSAPRAELLATGTSRHRPLIQARERPRPRRRRRSPLQSSYEDFAPWLPPPMPDSTPTC